MRFEKLPLFNKLVAKNILPTSPFFQSSALSEIENSVLQEVEREYLAPETFAKIKQAAKNFKYSILSIWKNKKQGNYETKRTRDHISGGFDIHIERVQADGELVVEPQPNTTAAATTSGLRKVPAPKPYSEKGTTSQYLAAASIVKSNEPGAIYDAASMHKVGKSVDTDIPYVMKEMKNSPGTATDIRNWLQLRRQKKGSTYLCTYYYFHITKFAEGPSF